MWKGLTSRAGRRGHLLRQGVWVSLILLAGLGCKRDPGSVERAGNPGMTGSVDIDGRGFNVLLISVDTTRADHLGCYGHPVVKTPHIDRFAAQGTRFTQCISSAPLTLPSHSTMMTGSQPFVHGARDNGIYVLNEKNVTLAEIFKEAGYATHGEAAAEVLNSMYQLNQGFDTYGDPGSVRLKFLERWRARADRTRLGLDPEPPEDEQEDSKVYLERSAEEIAEAALKRLEQKASGTQPFFMFLHFFDPHWPHIAPPRFADQYSDGYFAEIAYFDEQFGRIIEALEDLGLASRTLVILTSDHGEGRGQHGEQTHANFLYDATLHVPLIMWCPGQVPAGQVVESQVRLLDLAPTIVDFTGLKRTAQMQGASLVPLLKDPSRDLELMAYSDTEVVHNVWGFSVLRSLRGHGWKYILCPDPELFEVSADPLELFNLASERADLAADMRQQLYDLIAESPPSPGGRAARNVLDEEAIRRLEALGYLSGSSQPKEADLVGTELDHFEPQGPNPVDYVEAITFCNMASGSLRVGMNEEAEMLLRRVIELVPNHRQGHSLMGETMLAMERFEEAEKSFVRALELDPSSSRDHRFLAGLCVRDERWEQAEASYRAALKLKPSDLYCYVRLGRLLTFQRRYVDALKEYDVLVDLAPDVSDFHLFRGTVLRLAKRFEDSLVAVDKAAELDPSTAQPYVQRSVTLRRMGRIDEAVEDLRQALSKMPEAASLHYALAECFMEKNELKLAQTECEQVAKLAPENAIAWQNLGANLVRQERYVEGIVHLRKAVEMDGESTRALEYLARALEESGDLAKADEINDRLLSAEDKVATAYLRGARLAMARGDLEEAIGVLRRGHETLPRNARIANDLAWRLATCSAESLRDPQEAVRVAERARELTRPGDVNALDTLAAAYAEAGRFDDAVERAGQALERAKEKGLAELAERIAGRLALYRQQRPYREPS